MKPQSYGLKISTVIPTYFDNGALIDELKRALTSLEAQTFKPEEVILTDDSKVVDYEDEIRKVVALFTLNVKYIKNSSKSSIGGNSNNGLSIATGDILHVLHQDDYLISSQAYEEVTTLFNELKLDYLFSGWSIGEQKFTPKCQSFIPFGVNTIGQPSVLFLLKNNLIKFDPQLKMFVDTDLYSRLHFSELKGAVLDATLIEIGVGPLQASKSMNNLDLQEELRIIARKDYINPKLITIFMISPGNKKFKKNFLSALLRNNEIHKWQFLLVNLLITLDILTIFRAFKIFLYNFLKKRKELIKTHKY